MDLLKSNPKSGASFLIWSPVVTKARFLHFFRAKNLSKIFIVPPFLSKLSLVVSSVPYGAQKAVGLPSQLSSPRRTHG